MAERSESWVEVNQVKKSNEVEEVREVEEVKEAEGRRWADGLSLIVVCKKTDDASRVEAARAPRAREGPRGSG